jgi:hypothetical protein
MQEVVNKSFIESWWKQHLAFIVPLSFFGELPEVSGIETPWQSATHFSSLHHVTQAGKVQGRNIVDPSNHPSDPKFNLNGEDTRVRCLERFGELDLTSVEEVCCTILELRERTPGGL